ncbi:MULTISPECIES: hypothetical protein [Methylobacterium]|jgi:hypothetical protein|uniref:Uncharacterized protein n=1 Tax=Methylobacterium longum TaxID=767694 RepID=A0ABT8ANS8_9HYPH|nr:MULTISPECIES: hypothetical protein [Methylobacterium]MCJ2103250.1 hypothetical protein [Methylobacterium sp. E-046]MDN3571064.1 hypothetical protein [Methylobacterium longum]GJE14202.1 hypothetical protein FOHLNKBM_5275 [Methylobacterium longum]
MDGPGFRAEPVPSAKGPAFGSSLPRRPHIQYGPIPRSLLFEAVAAFKRSNMHRGSWALIVCDPRIALPSALAARVAPLCGGAF